MRLLRSILRIKWQNFITNKEIRERTNCDTIENTLARNQLRWLGSMCAGCLMVGFQSNGELYHMVSAILVAN